MNIENSKSYNGKLNIYANNHLEKNKNYPRVAQSKNKFDQDKVFISDQAKKLLEEQKLIKKDRQDSDMAIFKDMLRSVKESSDPKNNPYDSMIKCIQIATRIINGDRVPGKDEQFLMEKEPKMYTTAIMLRQVKENPKKHKSLLEEEDNKDISLADNKQIDSSFIENISGENDSNE